jgi:hypothetical protein
MTKSPLDLLCSSASQRCMQLILIVLTGQLPATVDQGGPIRHPLYYMVSLPEEVDVVSSIRRQKIVALSIIETKYVAVTSREFFRVTKNILI